MWFQGAGMNISNVMGSADTSVVAASKKNKWKKEMFYSGGILFGWQGND